MELFRKEVMSNLPYKEHIKEHEAINDMFNVNCDNLKVEEHLKLHLEYQFKVGKLSKAQYYKYKL